MDPDNLFFTRRTALLMRLDYIVVLGLLLYFLFRQWGSLDLVHFIAAIVWQDLIGYYPAAAVFYLRGRAPSQRRVPRFFYVVYNIFHGVPLNAAVLMLWWAMAGGWEPAMLAIPIHLCIDRGFFGRFYKAYCIAFEPVSHPEFQRFSDRIARERDWGLPGINALQTPNHPSSKHDPSHASPGVAANFGRSAI